MEPLHQKELKEKIEERFIPNRPQEFASTSAPFAPIFQEEQTAMESSPAEKRENPPLKKRKRRMKRSVLYIGGSVLGFLMLFVGLMTLPIPFGKVVVEGDTTITPYALVVTEVLPNPVNVLQIDRAKVTSMLEQDLRVESVHSRYEFPATYVIDIIPSVPVAEVMTQFGYAAVDSKGRYVDVYPSLTTEGTPIISGLNMGNILVGDTVENPGVKAALTYLTALDNGGRKLIAEVNVENENSLVAYTLDGMKIKLGKPERMEDKAKLTKEILKDIGPQYKNVEYVDISTEAPFVKKR